MDSKYLPYGLSVHDSILCEFYPPFLSQTWLAASDLPRALTLDLCRPDSLFRPRSEQFMKQQRVEILL